MATHTPYLPGPATAPACTRRGTAASSPHCRRRSLVARAAQASSSDKSVWLLDYGAGNVRSVRNAIKACGYELKEVSV